MMDNRNEENEFKQEMFENLRQTGIMDSVKANLRKQIVDRLQTKTQSLVKDEHAEMVVDQKIPDLREKEFYQRHRIFGHMIADYLRTHSMNYSYSVFLPEMRINSNAILLREEICEAFNLEKRDYSALQEMKDELDQPLSALEILTDMVRRAKGTKKVNREVQTENFDKSKNLSMKLDDINHEYSSKLDYFKLVNSKKIEDSMIIFKRECEARCQAEIQVEVQRIRDNELMEMRSVEAERYQQMLLANRKQMDQVYNDKLESLKERERDVLELCKRKLEDLEKIQFENRQQHLASIDAMNKKELEFRRHSCLNDQTVKEERERLRKQENELRAKQKEYEQAKSLMNTKVEEDIRKRREQLSKDQQQHDFRQRAVESNIKEEQHFVQQQKEHTRNLEIQRQYLTDENDHLKRDIKELEFIRSQALKEIDSLHDQVRKIDTKYKELEEDYQSSNSQREILVKRVKQLTEELESKTILVDQRQSDQLQLHQTYTVDMERHHNRLIDTEKIYSLKLESLREKAINDNKFLRNENQEMKDINLKLDEEVSNLRRELRFVRRKLAAFESNSNQQELQAPSSSSQMNQHEKEGSQPYRMESDQSFFERTQPLRVATATMTTSKNREDPPMQKTNDDYRKNLDDIFQEMQQLKERARLELSDQP